MDAQQLFQQGVIAIRDQKDIATGRKLLLQSLRINPQNEMAWLWLSHIATNPNQRLRYVERVLAINPLNAHAQKLHAQLNSNSDQIRGKPIAFWQEKAMLALNKGDTESAIQAWMAILKVEPTHDNALRNAVQHLVKLGYNDHALELINRAIRGGITSPATYLTGIELAKRNNYQEQLNYFCERYIQLPTVDDLRIIPIIEQWVAQNLLEYAITLSLSALKRYPNSQALLTQHGELLEKQGKRKDALQYYERAAKLGPNTHYGRIADEKLANYAPVITDKERGSIIFAWRETFGITLFYFLLAFQDAGLDIAQFSHRWSGIILSLVGGYLFVTATSSPQQHPLATYLGGQIPKHTDELVPDLEVGAIHTPTQLPIIPTPIRWVFGIAGVIILGLCFLLCFSRALGLLANPVAPYIIPFEALLGF